MPYPRFSGYDTYPHSVPFSRMYFLSNTHWGSEKPLGTSDSYHILLIIHRGRLPFIRSLCVLPLLYRADILNSFHLLLLINM